jgi:type II secretory pathway pseudopilin PulG
MLRGFIFVVFLEQCLPYGLYIVDNILRRSAMKSSMTLIEIIMAMMVMTIIIMGIASAYLASSSLNERTSMRIAAANSIRAEMEDILSRRKNVISSGGSTFSDIDALIKYYQTGTNTSFTVSELDQGTGQIIMYLNESQVPAECDTNGVTYTDADGNQFGPLEMDGDVAGDAGYQTENHSSSSNGKYATNMVPIEIRLTWMDGKDPMEMRRFMVVARFDQE